MIVRACYTGTGCLCRLRQIVRAAYGVFFHPGDGAPVMSVRCAHSGHRELKVPGAAVRFPGVVAVPAGGPSSSMTAELLLVMDAAAWRHSTSFRDGWGRLLLLFLRIQNNMILSDRIEVKINKVLVGLCCALGCVLRMCPRDPVPWH